MDFSNYINSRSAAPCGIVSRSPMEKFLLVLFVTLLSLSSSHLNHQVKAQSAPTE